MSKVFVNIGLSLDGYMAPEGMTMGKPEHKNWGAKWGALMGWLVTQQSFRENLKFGPGGETGPPVYVLTHDKREPWVRPGGTTFHFVKDGPERALELARASAGSRDIRISGGADVIQQYLNLNLVDELEIALAPVLFCGGRRLFENIHEPGPKYRIDTVLQGPAATHLRYVRA